MRKRWRLKLRPDLKATHKNAVELLRQHLAPIHYRTVYDGCVEFSSGRYSEKTDPAEKFRQRYGNEKKNKEIAVVPSTGDLVLRHWYPDRMQLCLLPPEPHNTVIKGDCIVSYEAGYDQGRRFEYTKDYFNDQNSKHRHIRRQRAKLAEQHVKHYFKTNYPDYYRDASNEGKYKIPSKDDFSLSFPGEKSSYNVCVDIKTWTKDGGGVIRNTKDDVLYLWCDWIENHTVRIDGIEWGRFLKQFGFTKHDLLRVANTDIVSADVLFVVLNMAKQGKIYKIYNQLLHKNE